MAAAVAVAAGCVCLGLVCGNERTPPLASRRRCCVGGQPPFHRGSRPSASLTAAGGLPPYKAGAVCVCVIGWGVSRWSWGWRCVEEWWVSVVCVAALLVGDFVAHPSVIDGGGGNVPHTPASMDHADRLDRSIGPISGCIRSSDRRDSHWWTRWWCSRGVASRRTYSQLTPAAPHAPRPPHLTGKEAGRRQTDRPTDRPIG